MSEVAQTATAVAPSLDELGIEDFSAYSLVIDARSPHEYEEDHIPGAINLPVVDDEQFALVGTTYTKDPHAAYLIGAEYAALNLAKHIRNHIVGHSPGERLLVYCFRGGKRSRFWSEMLRGIGFRTDVLNGGWKAYRRWVRANLEVLPLQFEYRVLSGLTGCGKTRLLQELERQGNQVLDLEGLSLHRGSLLGAVPGKKQPTQKQFEGLLVEVLRHFDPSRPVWVEAESKKVGNLQIPEALFAEMQRSVPMTVTAPLPQRVRLLKEEYPHFVSDGEALIATLAPLKPLIGANELELWRSYALSGDVDKLVERMLVAHYDPSYSRSHRRNRTQCQDPIRIEVLPTERESLFQVAAQLTRLYGARTTQPRGTPS